MKKPRPRRRRVIEQLRDKVPGRWTYDRVHGSRWVHESGMAVVAYAELAPRHDMDDETTRTVYRDERTGERVLGAWPKLLRLAGEVFLV